MDCQPPNITSVEEGILAAFDAGTTIGYGRFFSTRRAGHLFTVAAFFCGCITVGEITSFITTDAIVSHLEGDISSLQDLKGKRVAVVKGTTSEALVREHTPRIVECDDFYKAVVELRLGDVDAVVADDPVVRSYVKEYPTHASLAGSKFHAEDYGIAFHRDTDPALVKQFSIAIARQRESGKLSLIEKQWFGEEQ